MSGVDCGGDDNDDVVVIAGVCVCVRALRGVWVGCTGIVGLCC